MFKYSVGSVALVTLVGFSFLAGVGPVAAGSPVSFDVGGETLEFNNIDDVDVADLPYTYQDILPGLTEGCLQGRIQRTLRQNVDVNDVDEAGSVEIEFDLEANPDDEPVGIQALTEWQLDFLFDADCDPSTVDSVPAELRNMCLHMEDIDLYQFFGVAGSDTYVRSSDSELDFVHRSGFLTAVDTTNSNSDFGDQNHWAQFSFESVSSFRFRIGIDEGSDDDDAVFHLAFSCPEWTVDTVERSSAVQYSSPSLDYYQGRAEESVGSLPNTR